MRTKLFLKKISVKICLFIDNYLLLSAQTRAYFCIDNTHIDKKMENRTENINQGRPVYFSYARNSYENQTEQPQAHAAQFQNLLLLGIVFLIFSLTSCRSTTNNKESNVGDSAVASNVDGYDISAEDEDEIFEKASELYSARKYSETISCLENLANKGKARAQLGVGGSYYAMGDYKKAVEWFRKAAEQGYDVAQFYLGICYENGHGVSQNYDKAFGWFLKSAKQEYASAQLYVGLYYYSGEGVDKNYTKAVEWLQKAAEQGLAEAQYNLGVCYEMGKGVQKDISKAKEWFQKAADQGDEDAVEKLNKLQ